MKIAENVMVFVKDHFDKWRPFEIIKGRMSRFCTFPNQIKINDGPKTQIYASDCIVESENKPLFVKGNEFRAGVYYGDVYSSPGARYYLFQVTSEPAKILDVDLNVSKGHIELLLRSGGYSLPIPIKRNGTVEGDIEIAAKKIKVIKGSISNLEDMASEKLESYIRRYYLLTKINKVGGKNGGKFKDPTIRHFKR